MIWKTGQWEDDYSLQDVTRCDKNTQPEPDAKNRNLAAHQKDEEGNSRPQDLLTEGDPGSGHWGGTCRALITYTYFEIDTEMPHRSTWIEYIMIHHAY